MPEQKPEEGSRFLTVLFSIVLLVGTIMMLYSFYDLAFGRGCLPRDHEEMQF